MRPVAAPGGDDIVDEVTLPDHHQGEYSPYKGNNRSDHHELVERVRKADPVRVSSVARAGALLMAAAASHAARL